MRIRGISVLAPMILGLASAAAAQTTTTTTTYKAPTGQVTSTMIIMMNLAPSGRAMLEPSLANCYLGYTCMFYGSLLSYTLADGSTASLSNFAGVFAPIKNVANAYKVSGHASGVDSLGRKVKVNSVAVTMTITGHSGRGGGSTKTYTGGTITITN